MLESKVQLAPLVINVGVEKAMGNLGRSLPQGVAPHALETPAPLAVVLVSTPYTLLSILTTVTPTMRNSSTITMSMGPPLVLLAALQLLLLSARPLNYHIEKIAQTRTKI